MRAKMAGLVLVSLLVASGCHYRYDGCSSHDDWDDECDEGWCAPRADGGPRGDAARVPGDDDAGPALPGPECSADADCDPAKLCVEGACVPRDDVCHSDSECGAGRGCVDAACRPFCESSDACPSGTTCEAGRCLPTAECESDAMCAAGERCVEQRCLPSCDAMSPCAHPEDLCSAEGLCRPDAAPRPFCLDDSECAAGRLCLSGVCRTPCPSGEHAECFAWDSQFVRCALSESGLNLCFTRQDWDPECLSASQCEPGERCIDAFCH